MRSFKRIEDGKKKTKILKTIFLSSRLLCDVERFPEPAEVVTFPRQGVDLESFSVGYEGWSYVQWGMFSRGDC